MGSASKSTWRLVAVVLVVSTIAIAGCPREPAPEPTPDETITVSRGIITAWLRRYVESKSAEPFEQFGVTGIFPRYDIEKEDIVDNLLGARVPEPDLALDTCSQPVPVLRIAERRGLAGSTRVETAIELIDVGNLSVSFGRAHRAIPTRTFPDLLKVIDGVIYTADDSQRVLFVPGETYTFRTTGTDEVAPFEVVLEAPSDLGDVKLDGIQPDEQMPIVRRGDDLEIAWEGAGYGDEVVVELSWVGMGLPWSVTCRARDDGLFVIPPEITQALHDPLGSEDEEMTLTRVRQVAFRSQGLSSGAFSFVVSNSFPVRFGPGR